MSLAQVLRETGIDSQRHCDVTSIDEISNLAVIRELMLNVEIRARGESGDEFATFLAVIQVEHGRWHVIDLECRSVTEHQHLDDGRAKQDEPGAFVAKHLDEFLDQHLFEARQHDLS